MNVLERLSCARRDLIVSVRSASSAFVCQVSCLRGICDVDRAMRGQKAISHEVFRCKYTKVGWCMSPRRVMDSHGPDVKSVRDES